jgi:hypothetical protein
MRKRIWIGLIACAMAGGAAPAFGYDYENDDPPEYVQVLWGHHGLDSDVNQLNRMLGHVRWQLRNYKKGPQFRDRFEHIARDVDKLNAEFRKGDYKPRKLRDEIYRLRRELHQIEIDLHVKKADLYR